MAFNRGLIVQSESVLNSIGESVSEVTPNNIISPIIDEIGAIVGAPIPSGKFSRTIGIRSFTICLARYISVPQSNSTHTIEIPAADEDRILLTFGEPFNAVSNW